MRTLTLKILAAAVAMAAVTPVMAQEVGGAIGTGPQPGDTNYRGYYRDYPPAGISPGEVAGDVVGGAIGSDSYAMAPDDSYCAQRYRSYDPASGTYLGFDGRRHRC